MAYSSLRKNRGREARCRPERILYTQKPPGPSLRPSAYISPTRAHTHTHPIPLLIPGQRERNAKGRRRRQRKLEDGRWEGPHDANPKSGPLGLGSREARKQDSSVITGCEGPRNAGTTREGGWGGGGSHYTLRRKWFRAGAPRPRSPPNSRQTQDDGHSRGARPVS